MAGLFDGFTAFLRVNVTMRQPFKLSGSAFLFRKILAVVLLLSLSGCAAYVPGSGFDCDCGKVGWPDEPIVATIEVKGRTYADIWQTTIKTISLKMTVLLNEPASGSIQAIQRTSRGSWETMDVKVSPHNDNAPSYLVEVKGLSHAPTSWTVLLSADLRTALEQE